MVGALFVVGAAIAVVVSAGGVLAGIGAVASVIAGGSAATLGTTIAAGVFIGASTTFIAMGISAGISSIGVLTNGGSFNSALNNFASFGESAMWSTISGGVFGVLLGYSQYKTLNTFSGTHTPGESTSYSTYKNIQSKTITHYDKNGNMWWSKHLTNHGRPDLHPLVPHWHWESPHNTNYMSRFEFIWEFIKRIF